MEKNIIFTGIRPTGDLHLGHFLSVVRPLIKLSERKDNHLMIMIADLHGLTELRKQSMKEVAQQTKQYTTSIITTLSRFIDISEITIFSQSDLMRYHYDLFYKLLMISKHSFTFGNPVFLDAMKHEYFSQIDQLKLTDDVRELLKEYIQDNNEILWGHISENHLTSLSYYIGKTSLQTSKIIKQLNERLGVIGVASYPILMAADILLYAPNQVLVGKDQAPHLQITNDIIKLLNKIYNKRIKYIDPLIVLNESIKGSDGRKMSKSYFNYLPVESLFVNQGEAARWIKNMVNYPRRLEEVGNPNECNVGGYLKAFSNKDEFSVNWDKCSRGVISCVECKAGLMKLLNDNVVNASKYSPTPPENIIDVLYLGALEAYERIDVNTGISPILFPDRY